MKQKLIFIICIIYAFFVGVCSTVVLINKKESKPVLNEVIKEVIPVTNEIENKDQTSSIDKIYNAVLLIENFKQNTLSTTGTGFVYKVDDQGYIITNYHVIEGATKIKTINMNNKECDAKMLGYDKYLDIAVLSIPLENVIISSIIGDSTKLKLGDTLFAVGSPLGLEYMGTVTKGILSGLNRKVSVDTNNGSFVMDVLQTDAAINPGNSGGPLINSNGEVIGVTSMKLVKDEIEGMGFAIPIELVMASIDKLEKGETIKRPYLGIEVLDLSDNFIIENNIPNDIEGIIIINIEEDSVASKYELKSGDIITYINEEKIIDSAHFKYMLYKYNIGDTITLKYIRDNKEYEKEIIL